jgi:hypothetical protein
LVPSAVIFVGAVLLLSPLLVTWLISQVNQAARARYLPTAYAHGQFETPPFKVWWGAPYDAAIGMDMELLDTPFSVKRSIPSASCQETKTLDWSVINSSRLTKSTGIEPTLR